jgi:MFS family permease
VDGRRDAQRSRQRRYIADLSQPEMRGRYQGVASLSYTFASFVSPVFGGMLLDHAAPATLWLVLAARACLSRLDSG